MGAKRRDRGDYDEVRRHGSYVVHKAAKHDEHRTAYRDYRYAKYSKGHGSSRHSHHDAQEHRRPLQHYRSDKKRADNVVDVEPVMSTEKPLGNEGIVDLNVEDHRPDNQFSKRLAEEHKSTDQAEEHKSTSQAEEHALPAAVPEVAADAAQEVELVTAQEGGGAEEELVLEGVPHTPEVQDLKCSSPSGACRIVDEFEKLGRLGEGTYGVVYKARDKRTGEIVALKKIKMYNQDTEGFPVTSLREINLLISLQHPSIVNVREVVVGKDMDSVFMVMEHIEDNLKDTMARLKQPFNYGQIKCMMLQLLQGVACLHDNWVLHRDLKPSNILVTSEGELRICDFGLARRYDSPIKTYTHNVVTMWYRAPELLVSKNKVKYSTAIDVWSLGCIMAELILNEPLFAGDSEIDQIRRIKKVIPRGSFENLGFIFPSQKLSSLRERILYPAAHAGRPILSEKGFDLLSRLLAYDPEKRITAKEALNHVWFEEEPLPGTKELPADVFHGKVEPTQGLCRIQEKVILSLWRVAAATMAVPCILLADYRIKFLEHSIFTFVLNNSV